MDLRCGRCHLPQRAPRARPADGLPPAARPRPPSRARDPARTRGVSRRHSSRYVAGFDETRRHRRVVDRLLEAIRRADPDGPLAVGRRHLGRDVPPEMTVSSGNGDDVSPDDGARREQAVAGLTAFERRGRAAPRRPLAPARERRVVGLGEVDEPAVVAEDVVDRSSGSDRARAAGRRAIRSAGRGSRSGRTCPAPPPAARPIRAARRRSRSSARPRAARRRSARAPGRGRRPCRSRRTRRRRGRSGRPRRRAPRRPRGAIRLGVRVELGGQAVDVDVLPAVRPGRRPALRGRARHRRGRARAPGPGAVAHSRERRAARRTGR